jgi:hypothetical protein
VLSSLSLGVRESKICIRAGGTNEWNGEVTVGSTDMHLGVRIWVILDECSTGY